MLIHDYPRSAESAALNQTFRGLDSALDASHSKSPPTIMHGAQPRTPMVRVDAGVPNSAASAFTVVHPDNLDNICQIKKLDACIADKLGKLSQDNPKIRFEKALIELASTTDDQVRFSAREELFAIADANVEHPEKSIEMRLPALVQYIATEVLENLVNLLAFRSTHPELFIQRVEPNQEKLLTSIFLSVRIELMTRYALQLQRQRQYRIV